VSEYLSNAAILIRYLSVLKVEMEISVAPGSIFEIEQPRSCSDSAAASAARYEELYVINELVP
jgi:hypothetical protein